MKPLASRIVTDSSGHTLRCYELKTARRRVGHPFHSPHACDRGGLRRTILPSFSAPQSCSTGPARLRCFPSGSPQAEPRRPGECRRQCAEKQTEDNESAISVARNRVNTRFTKPTKRISLPWPWKSKSLLIPQ